MPIDAAAERLEFAPPPQPGLLKAIALAILAHVLLALMLAANVKWKRDSQDMTAEAELWSSLPQLAAPKEVVAPPPPPAPVVKEQPRPEPPKRDDAQIAIEEQKKKREAELAKQEAAEREQRREKERERQRKLAEEKRERDLKRQEEQRLAAENRRKEEAAKKRREEQEATKLAQLREENLRRIQGMAGASGSPSSTGTAAQSSGPSASWAGRVRGRVKPNIVFTDDVAGNPAAEVEVRLAPDGTIVSRRLLKSSGHKGWDETVMRALDKTEILPRDTDGSVPRSGTLVFRPKD